MYLFRLEILQSELNQLKGFEREVAKMGKSKKNTRGKESSSNRGKKAPSVTPQGYGDTEFAEEPKSKLENAAKKKNTK